MKRLCSFFLVMLVICCATLPAFAVDYGCDVEIESTAAYVEDLNTSTVVFDKNAEEKRYPASTTKVMTFIIVSENVPDPENTKVEITESALSTLDPESSVMGLEAHIGETVTVIDLLYGLMLPSGNDAALVLADYVGKGNIDSFVELMNQKAAQLGCKNTHFVNPHGFYDERHYSTAKDMATITKYALEKPFFNEICSTPRYSVKSYSGSSEPETIETTNYMLDETQKDGYYYRSYIKGIKTGYTEEAGRCLISRAQKDDYNYLCVTLGAPYSFDEDIYYSMLDTAALDDWAFENLAYKDIYTPSDVLRTVGVGYVWGDRETDLVPAENVSALLPKDYDEDLVKTKIECVDTLMAPVKKGQKVGSITVTYDDLEIGTTDIVATEDIARDETNYIAHQIIDFIKNHIIIVLIAIVVIILLIVLLSIRKRNRRIARAKERHRYR